MKFSSKTLVFAIAIFLLGAGSSIGILALSTPVFTDARNAKAYPVDIASMFAHAHKMVDLLPGQSAPTLSIDAVPDMMKAGNYNLHIVTSGFAFSPEMTSMEPTHGTGHAHVYVDHALIGRAYSEWFHIPKLRSGKHEIYVTLNRNDHKEYSINGKPIDATVVITTK